MKCFLSIVLLPVAIGCYAQKVTVNIGVDTITNEANKQIIWLWRNYLKSNPDSLYNNPYWNEEEKLKYKSYDLINSEGFYSPSFYAMAKYYKNLVMSITPKEDYFILRSAFYDDFSESKNCEVIFLAITHIIAKKVKGNYYLFNYLPFHTRQWKTEKVGVIEYRFHPQHPFNRKKAREANRFLTTLTNLFSLKPEPVTYYIAQDCDEIFRAKGFDYALTMGAQRNCGFYDATNRIVYAVSESGENHQHELVHYINDYFPKAHSLLLLGVSSYWGGENAHQGKPLLYHIKRVNEFLKKNPSIDLNKVLDFHRMDNETNPQYVVMAILIDEILKKGGKDLLIQSFSKGKEDENLYDFIETDLGIKKNNLNAFMRKRIEDISKAGHFEAIDIK